MEFVDLIARPLGWLVALMLAMGVIVMSVAAGFTPYAMARRRGGRARIFVSWLLAGPIMAAVAVAVWRVARFAGGYVGSSEYPLHHLFRIFS